ncbi:MAG: SpaA isopeptide-forming pilin-related protein [Thomasclavelia sp.]
MKRSFKSFKLPKAIRRVFALLLVCGVFAVAGLAYATGENNSMNRDSIIESLGQANNFAVFAENFTNNNHMEGSIAVKNLLGASSNMGNTDNVYSYTEQSVLNIKIEKTVTNLENLAKTFNIGIYQKNSNGSYALIDSVTINTDNTGKGSTNVDTTKLVPNTKYYFFEIDDEGNPITGNSGVIGGQEYNVSISSSSSESSTIDTPAYGVGNVSYIENFYNGNESIELFQSNNKQKPTVVVGKDNKYSAVNNNQNVLTGVDGKNYKLGPNATVIMVEDSFPINFEKELENLANVSKNIATVTNSDTVKVINIPLNENGQIEYNQISSNGENLGIADNNAWNNNGLKTDGKLLILNVDCTNVKDSVYVQGCKIDGNDAMNWNKIANSVIWNFYTTNRNSYNTYNGKITYNGGLGTILAPNATVSCTQSTNGSVIANTVDHPNCEIHHIKLTEVNVEKEKNINVSVTNTPTDTGSLKITKKVTVNNTLDIENNGTYKFKVTGADENNKDYVKEISFTVENGQGEYILSGLEPGRYTITEIDVPNGMTVNKKSITVEVVKGATINADATANFVNNREAGSLKIEKTVTVNGKDTNTTLVDGKYNFTITNDDDSSIKYTTSIEINQGVSKTVQIDGIVPGNYTVSEVIDENSKFTLTNGNDRKIKVEANNTANIPLVSFNNNLENVGSLKVTKVVTDNGQENIDYSRANGIYKFELRDSSGNIAKNVKGEVVGNIEIKIENSNSNSITVSDLEPGKYTIEEVDIPDSMELVDKVNKRDVQVVANTTTDATPTEVTFTNNVKRGSLKITKYVTINGEDPSNSTLADGTYIFEVKNGNNVVAKPTITIKDGKSSTETVTGLLPGTYTVVETKEGTGQATLVESKNTTIEIKEDKITNVQTAEFTNNIDIEVGSLYIKKNVTLNGKATENEKLNGTYAFDIIKDNVVLETKYINIDTSVDTTKTILVGNLEPGDYVIKEKANTNGLSLIGNPNGVPVTVVANDSTGIPTAEFTNNLTQGEIEITKKVTLNGAETNEVTGEFKFIVKDANNEVVAEPVIKISKGEKFDTATVKGLKPGKYTVSEVATKGFELTGVEIAEGTNGTVDENNVVTVEIKENTTGKAQVEAVTFTNNKEVGSLKITKNVTLNGNPTDKVNETYMFVVINENGETVAEKSIKIEEGKSKTVTVDNLKPGRYTVKEVVENLENGTTITEGKDGITVNVTANNSGDAIGVAEFTNNLTEGEIQITKEVTLNGSDPDGSELANGTFEFEVKDENGKVVAKPTITVKDGEAETKTLTGLKPGTYTIKETDSDGLELKGVEVSNGTVDENNVVTVEITDENTSKKAQVEAVTFTNNKVVTGSLEITKNVTVNGDPTESQLVDGKYTFEVKDEQGKVVATKEITITGGKSDTAKVEDLYPGKYTVSEVTTGFAENLEVTEGKDGVKVEITFDNYDKTQEVEFTNNLKVDDATLTIKKEIDKDTNQYSEAFDKLYTFKITNDEVADGTKYVANDGVNSITFNNGEATLTIKGDSEVSFAGLKAGEYKVEEIDAEIVDYKLTTDYEDNSGDKDDQTVELTDGQVAMITVTNSYEYDGQVADMSITKVLKNYNQTFKGGTFVFEVTGTKVNSNGETEMIYSGIIGATTDKAGNLSVDKLTNLPVEPGVTYTVKEVYSGSVYSPVNDTVVITLNSQEDIDRYKDENGKIVLTAAFENDYNGTTIGGAGVINIYGLNDGIKQVFE